MDVVSLAVATTNAKNLLRPKVRPVADRPERQLYSTAFLSNGTDLSATCRMTHTMTASAGNLRLVFTNFYNNFGAEADGPNSIVVKASIEEWNPSAMIHPVFFNGRREITVEPGACVVSDPVGIEMPKGQTFWTRTYVSVDQGDKWPLGLLTVIAHSEGVAVNLDQTDSGTVTPSADRGYNPASILGSVKSTVSPIIVIFGDSIAGGAADNNDEQGYIELALAKGYSFYNLSLGQGSGVLSNTTSKRRRRFATVQPGATHAICEFGINEISAGLSQYQTVAAGIWASLVSRGYKVYQSTLSPFTTSTDGWVTVGNQTVGANEAARVAINDWIRTTPSPLSGYFEIADLAESARNSGKWRANYTIDGLHPNGTGATAMSAGINPAIFGAVAI